MSNLLCIRTFGKLDEANIAKGLLVSNGIEADIFINSSGAYAPNAVPLGARLMVREEDKEKALKLLENLKKD